jgi:hypothetical protein
VLIGASIVETIVAVDGVGKLFLVWIWLVLVSMARGSLPTYQIKTKNPVVLYS